MAAALDIGLLEAQLTAAVHNTTLTLGIDDLPRGFIRGFLRVLKSKTLILGNVTITRKDQLLTIASNQVDGLPVPGIDGALLGKLDLEIWFQKRPGVDRLLSGITILSAETQIDGMAVPLSGRLVTGASFGLVLEATAIPGGLSLPNLERYSPDLLPSANFSQSLSLFAATRVTGFSLEIQFLPVIRTIVRAELAPQSTQWQPLPIGVLKFTDPRVEIEAHLPYQFGWNQPVSNAVGIRATVDLAGAQFDVTIARLDSHRWAMILEPGDDAPSVETLIGHGTTPTLQADLDAVLQKAGIRDPQVDFVRVEFDTEAMRVCCFDVQGEMTLYDQRMDLALRLEPALSLAGGFTARNRTGTNSGLHISALIKRFFPEDETFPEITINELDFALWPADDLYAVYCRIDSDWTIAIAHQKLVFRSLEFALRRQKGEVRGNVSASVEIGGVDFTVGGGRPVGEVGWVLEGAMAQTTPVNLKTFVASIFDFFRMPLPSHAPDVLLSNLHMRFETASESFFFGGVTDVPIEIPFLDSAQSKIHAQLELGIVKDQATGGHKIEGSLIGELALGEADFTLRFDLAQDRHVFTAMWEAGDGGKALGADTLLAALGITDDLGLPKGIDISLNKVLFEYDAGENRLNLTADSAAYGTAFLIATKAAPAAQAGAAAQQASWTFLFGIEFTGVARISQIPVLGSGLAVADGLSFTNIGLAIASSDFSGFSVPQMPGEAKQAAAKGGFKNRQPFVVGRTLTLGKGISFVGEVDLSSSGPDVLKSAVSTSVLLVNAAFDPTAKSITLRALLDGEVGFSTGGDSRLTLRDVGVELAYSDEISFGLFGSMTICVQDKRLDLKPYLRVEPEVIELAIALAIKGGWVAPLGIEGLTLETIGFELGIDILPAPGVNVGLSGAFHIGQQAAAADSFALVFELVEEVPNPLLLAFNIDRIDIATAMELFVPSVSAQDIPQLLTDIELSNVEFYWAESDVPLPDGTVARPGFRMGGNIDLLGFKAHARLVIDKVSGIEGEIQTAPIHIGNLLNVTGHSEGLYRTEENGKPVPLKVRPEKTAAPATRVEIVPPGGPALAFRTARSPYLSATLVASIFDLLEIEVEALVDDKGFDFKLVYAVGSIAHAELDILLNKDRFALYSQFALHLKADIGPIVILGADLGTIHLDAGFDLEMSIDVDADKFDLQIWGDFEFEGARLTLPKLHIDTPIKSLTDLPAALIAHIGEEAEEIFKELFDEVGQFFEDAGKEIVQVAEEVGEEIVKIGEEAVAEAEQIVTAAEQAIDDVGKAVTDLAEEAEKEVVKIGEEAAAEITKLGAEVKAEVEEIGHQIEQVATAALVEIEAIGREIEEEAEAVEKAVVEFAEAAAREVAAIFDAVEQEVAQILAEAQRIADAIVDEARAIANAIEEEAEAIWNKVEQLAAEAEALLEEAGKVIEDGAAQVWGAISKY
jgi:hypothetical protein